MLTKGFITKALKEAGIRRAEKDGGGTVKLEHLKTYQLTKLYFDMISNSSIEKN